MDKSKDRHYIVTEENCEECQRYLFKKGFRWIGLKSEVFNPFKEDKSYYDKAKNENQIVIHAFYSDRMRLGWNFVSIVKDEYYLEEFHSREKKLKRILNGR